jgi:general secretion pathway protein D
MKRFINKRILCYSMAFSLLITPLLAQEITPTEVIPAEPESKPESEMIGTLTFREMSLDQVLDLLQRLTGRSVIRPQALPAPTFTFDSVTPLTKAEGILVLESLLTVNGIGVTRMNDKLIKVVPIQQIKTEAPELVIGSLKDRPASGQVVSKLFRLKYLDSSTFQTQIQPFLSPAFNSIIPFQNSNAVIVTDTISNLQRLEYVVSEVDQPSRLNIKTKFYTLQYATASEVAQQLKSLIDSARSGFGTQQTPQQSRQTGPSPRPVAAGTNTAQDASLQAVLGSNISINSDDRTNQLILITDPSTIPFFDDIIEKLDVTAEASTKIEVIRLQHADATEMASLLSNFVSGRSGSSSRNSGNVSRANTSGSSRNSTFRQNDQTNRNSQRQSQSRLAQTVQAAVEDRDSQFSDFMTIVADERSNALIISGTNNDLELMTGIVQKIDVLLAQVLIEVVIAEVNLNDSSDRGIDSFGVSYANDGSGTETFSNVSGKLGPLSVSNGTAIFSGGELSSWGLDAVFNAAKTNSNVKVLSAPQIVTTHNKEGSIIVGESRPIITSSQTSISGGDTTRSNVQFQDIGIELKVKPLIGPNNVIQLEIDQTIDDVVGQVPIDGNDQPIIGRKQATSFVSVKSGEMVVLGGLRSIRDEKSKGRMFILGQIPIIRELFTRKGKRYDVKELLVFIRPVVIRTTDDATKDAETRLDSLMESEKIKEFMEPSKEDEKEEE